MFGILDKLFRKKKLLKIKQIEKNFNKYLIERVYKHNGLTEFIVCESYNFKTNNYLRGKVFSNLRVAYDVYNDFVLHDNFDILNKFNEEE